MRSRFPHGGDVLGAAPANPILAPVLSQDRGLSMSRQRDLLDLQAIQRIPGLAGYWKNDPQYMFEDSAGTTPASTSGTGVVGQWPSVGNAPSLGPLLNTNGDCEAGLPFSKADGSGSVSTLELNTTNPISGTQDARLIITTAATSRPSLAFTGISAANNIVGATYRIQFDYKVNTGSFKIWAINNGSNTISVNTSLTGTGTFVYDVTCAGTTVDMCRLYCGDSVCDVQLDNVKIQQVTGLVAYQAATANKPILRQTPTTGVYWLDANTSTSALNVALGNLGSACTVARSGAEGVTFTENVSITSTYNIAPAFSFNSDVAIFNRALTETEKALITRYMARAVPLLGSNLITNGTFDTDTAWTKGTGWSIGSGVASKSAGTASNFTQSVGVSGAVYYAKADAVVTAGTIGAYPGSGTTQFGSTSATGTLAHAMKASGTGIGVRGDASFAGNVDNATIKEIL